MELGQKLHYLRTLRNINIAQLSQETGFSRSHLYSIESGQTVPPLSTIETIADACGFVVIICFEPKEAD